MRFPSFLELGVFHKAKSIVYFSSNGCSKLAKNALKELGSLSKLSSFLRTVIRNSLRNLFSASGVISSFASSRLSKKEIHGTEQHIIKSFSWCFHFPVRL